MSSLSVIRATPLMRRDRTSREWPSERTGTRRAWGPHMINASQIKPNTPVVCSEDGQFAVVDHMEGTNDIKLAKDDKGVHHF
ncbi:MAG TPA: DUF2171 domain-containing protein, partial [Labilithrix sp.]|nr:DUF2171 domain-containing protein [Labilithrix sp.]